MERDIKNEVLYNECCRVIEKYKEDEETMSLALYTAYVELGADEVSYTSSVCLELDYKYHYELSKLIYGAFKQYKAFIEYRKIFRLRNLHRGW